MFSNKEIRPEYLMAGFRSSIEKFFIKILVLLLIIFIRQLENYYDDDERVVLKKNWKIIPSLSAPSRLRAVALLRASAKPLWRSTAGLPLPCLTLLKPSLCRQARRELHFVFNRRSRLRSKFS